MGQKKEEKEICNGGGKLLLLLSYESSYDGGFRWWLNSKKKKKKKMLLLSVVESLNSSCRRTRRRGEGGVTPPGRWAASDQRRQHCHIGASQTSWYFPPLHKTQKGIKKNAKQIVDSSVRRTFVATSSARTQTASRAGQHKATLCSKNNKRKRKETVFFYVFLPLDPAGMRVGGGIGCTVMVTLNNWTQSGQRK